MSPTGPALETLLRRLTECPPEFQDMPGDTRGAQILLAIICDTLRDWNVPPDANTIQTLNGQINKCNANLRSLLGIVVWLLADDWFVEQRELVSQYPDLLNCEKLNKLAGVIPAHLVVTDADRREELVRIVLNELGLRPAGETAAQSADRLNTLDSVERQGILQATAASERRAREVREAMARKKALESASRYGE